MSLEQEQRNLSRKQSELTDIERKLAAQQSKYSAAVKKANDAQSATSRARSESTRKSKLRTYETSMRDASRYQKEISRLQDKKANKQKEINNATAKVAKEQKRADQAAARKAEQEARKLKEEMGAIGHEIAVHDSRITSLETGPSKVSVLYLGTSPKNADHLRIDQEARDIHEAIRKSDNPQRIDFNDRWAVRQTDLLQALNETDPDIVHFSGHGAPDGSIALEDQLGKVILVSKEQLAMVVGATAKHVRLIVFNACHSDEEAAKVLAHVDAVIGMQASVSDEASLAFAAQLYSSIGFGHSLAIAFNQAVAAIALAAPGEINTPKLRLRDGLEAEDITFVEEKGRT